MLLYVNAKSEPVNEGLLSDIRRAVSADQRADGAFRETVPRGEDNALEADVQHTAIQRAFAAIWGFGCYGRECRRSVEPIIRVTAGHGFDTLAQWVGITHSFQSS